MHFTERSCVHLIYKKTYILFELHTQTHVIFTYDKRPQYVFSSNMFNAWISRQRLFIRVNITYILKTHCTLINIKFYLNEIQCSVCLFLNFPAWVADWLELLLIGHFILSLQISPSCAIKYFVLLFLILFKFFFFFIFIKFHSNSFISTIN